MRYETFFTDQQIVMLKCISVEDFVDPDSDLDFGRKEIFDELSRLNEKKMAICRDGDNDLRSVNKQFSVFMDFLTKSIVDFRIVFLLVIAGDKFYGLKMSFSSSSVCGPRLTEFASSSSERIWARANRDCACLKPFVSVPR